MQAEYIWMNGDRVPWEQAQVHAMTHALHYGSSVFEGIRAYDTSAGVILLCGPDHFERLHFSCKVANMTSPLSVKEWMQVAKNVLIANKHANAYVRPLVYRGMKSIGLDGRDCPTESLLATFPWSAYLGEDAKEKGVDVCVSSWRRVAPDTLCAMAKIGGHYINGQHMTIEARNNGYQESIAMDIDGYISEGSGQNLFLVYKGEVYTPECGNSILMGITRQCIMTLAEELGYTVKEKRLPREMLHLADELFFTGTATEVCPIHSVDKQLVGKDGKPGPVTRKLMDRYFDIIQGKTKDKWHWLEPVN